MKKSELLKNCRYYKQEQLCPFEKGNEDMFWHLERLWCENVSKDADWSEQEESSYVKAGLEDFHKDVPLSLRAVLYDRYCHWLGGYGDNSKGFKDFYETQYLKKS